MTGLSDAAERARAVDPCCSFCVSAPAGSGKTELLIQRFLTLLTRVNRPEQVLAITFTRKAAAEMRERVVGALDAARTGRPCEGEHELATRKIAQAVLQHDTARGWHLRASVTRFNIKTIDSFCAGLTRQMPVLSEFGGQTQPEDDVDALYVEAVQALFALLESDNEVAEDLAALMLHFDNNWEGLQTLLVGMLAKRGQWGDYLGVHHTAEESESYLVSAVTDVVEGHLLQLDASLASHRAALLSLMNYSGEHFDLPPLSEFPPPRIERLSDWGRLRELLLTQKNLWRKPGGIRIDMGFPAGKGEAEAQKSALKSLLAEFTGAEGLEQDLAMLSLLPDISEGSESWRLVLHLSRLLPVLAAQLLLVFERHGVVDHSQVALSALNALGEDDQPTELALRLDYSIEHILVDEFQDTAINQYKLIHKLTRGWGEFNQEHPQQPRTLMIVGDAMQSIYGFRDANVSLFITARERGFNGVELEHLNLSSNFRSDRNLVTWVNDTFSTAFPAEDDVQLARVRFDPAVPARGELPGSGVVMRAFSGEDAVAAELAYVCDSIRERIAEEGASVAVLGRTRSHLQPIAQRLRTMGIRYAAQDLDTLAHSSLVADLLTLCRVLSSALDRLAWMSLLRSPMVGIELADLLLIAGEKEIAERIPICARIRDSEVLGSLSEQGKLRVAAIAPVLDWAEATRDRLALRVWVEQVWLRLAGPACAQGPDALKDAESFLQLLELAETEGRGLDVEWLAVQTQKRYMEAGDPDCAVQLMTLHKAKGLEFDCVIIPRLDATTRGNSRDILLWDEISAAGGQRLFLLAADDRIEDAPTLYGYLRHRRKQKELEETTRLLYVGATRAIRHLMLTASLKTDDKSGEIKAPAERSLLNVIWPDFKPGAQVSETAGAAQLRPGEKRLFVRLRRELDGSAGESSVQTAGLSPEPSGNFPERPDNYSERLVGTVVHLALEQLSLCAQLPLAPRPEDERHWRFVLAQEGLSGEALDKALGRVARSVSKTLEKGGKGRWVLSAEHREARSEWPLTLPEGGEVRDIVIDRSFVERDTGVRWVVDYKNSEPLPGETLEEFMARESEHYSDQLARYARAVEHFGDAPVQCALFFTALGELQVVDSLQSTRGEH